MPAALRAAAASGPAACLLAAVLLGGCDVAFHACDDVAVPALSVAVVEAGTGAPVHADGFVAATDGGFGDTVRVSADDGVHAVSLAYERPGVYRVDVRMDGFEGWTLRDVRVGEDRCHVETERITAPLTTVGEAEPTPP